MMDKTNGIISRFFSKRLTVQFFIVLIFFTLIKLFLILFGLGGVSIKAEVLAPVSILYGFYISLLIGGQKTRYNGLFDANSTESSCTYTMYKLSETLPKSSGDRVQKLIAKYLEAQIDYRLRDYKMTDKEYDELVDECLLVSFKGGNNFGSILSLIQDQQEERYRMQSVIEGRISLSEWVTIMSLFLVTIYSFLTIETPGILNFIIGILICTAGTMMMLVLNKTNNLKLNSNVKIWEPLGRLFEEMGLRPYYPEPVLRLGGIAEPEEGALIRVASYPNPYPDMSGKVVKEVKYHKKDYR